MVTKLSNMENVVDHINIIRKCASGAAYIERGMIGSAVVELQCAIRMLAEYQKETGESVSPDQLKLFQHEQTSQEER